MRVGGVHRLGSWFALIVAFVLFTGNAFGQARGCSMPGQVCISGGGSDIGVDVSARQSGNGVPQTPSAGSMNVLIPIAVTVAAVGVAAVAIPAVGTAAVAGDVMASVGMTAIRGGIIGSVALATLMNHLGGDVRLDGNGNIVAPAAAGVDSSADGYMYVCNVGQTTGASPIAACAAFASALGAGYSVSGVAGACGGNFVCLTVVTPYGPDQWAATRTGDCAPGYVGSSGGCSVDPKSTSVQPATDAQIQNAIKAHPDSWPSIYNAMNCGPTLALTNGSTSDPCFALYSDSRTGFGVSFSTGGSSWTNNGCAVNSASCPSATVTTAPSTDSSTKTNADGSKTTTTNTTTKTTTVTGTNDRTNPVEGQTTTTTSTSTTVTNPDGSMTTTTTTTTDQAPPATGGNADQQNKDKTPPTTATFNGPSASLYTAKSKTFAQVLQAFVSRVQAMPWYSAVSGFFTVSIASGSCPSSWQVSASDWNPALDATPYVCGSNALKFYTLGGYVVLAVAGWAAFKIAFL
ncbi:hypothetical protein HGR00_10150 [Ralstonia insidiosa]|uniref:Uncharacterized protein n=2 Tax=Ralstonia insidiosa TaxID=190721 RepID=A0A848P0R9_9RALS|nr:hypothetical protein [Ralstonia insidiosa]